MSEFRGATHDIANLIPQNAAKPRSSTQAGFLQDPPFGHGISPVTHQPSQQLPPTLSHHPPIPNATFLAPPTGYQPPPSWPPPQLPTASLPPAVNMQLKAQQLQQSMAPGIGATQMHPSAPVIPATLNQCIDQSKSTIVEGGEATGKGGKELPSLNSKKGQLDQRVPENGTPLKCVPDVRIIRVAGLCYVIAFLDTGSSADFCTQA